MNATKLLMAGIALALIPVAGAEEFEQTIHAYNGREVRMEFEHLAPGVCVVKTWKGGLQVTPDVEWVYERMCSAGGTLVRYDWCVKMSRENED